MKSSWLAGIMLFYVGLLFLSMIAEHNVSANSADINLFNAFITPTGTDFSNPVVAVTSLVTDVWQYFKLIIQVVFLWFPDLWVGGWLWVYYVVCFPIAMMMVFTFVSILRGSFNT